MGKTIYSKDHLLIIGRLKQARAQADLDQAEVAKLIGKSQSYVSKIEAGQRKIDIIQLKDFAKVYKKDLSFFIE
ncbi:MAG TPA: helix-turn-helix transcriptional regulator [Candidatus Pacearchaeota archaeon]|nr:helix-turn-helix transcriptional regulator [Candidatus Pacearchaeota archaeon]